MNERNYVSLSNERKSIASIKVMTSESLKTGLAPTLPFNRRGAFCLYQSSTRTYMIVKRVGKSILCTGNASSSWLGLKLALLPNKIGEVFPFVNSISHQPYDITLPAPEGKGIRLICSVGLRIPSLIPSM